MTCLTSRAASARYTGANFMKLGRAPTMWRMCIANGANREMDPRKSSAWLSRKESRRVAEIAADAWRQQRDEETRHKIAGKRRGIAAAAASPNGLIGPE